MKTNQPREKISIKQADKEVPTEILADAIVSIAAGIRKLRSGRLNDRALFLLIQDAAPNTSSRYGRQQPLSMKDIRAVFEGIDSLEATYLRRSTKEGVKS